MSTDPIADLRARLARQHGPAALRPATDLSAYAPLLPSGTPARDALAGVFPRGQITELCGVPGSGVGTLVTAALASAGRAGRLVAIVDREATFDAATAAAHGVDLDALLIVRPKSSSAAITAITQLCGERDLALVVLDDYPVLARAPGGPAALQAAIPRWLCALRTSGGVLLVTTPHDAAPGGALDDAAALRLGVQRLRWDISDPLHPVLYSQIIVRRRGGGAAGGTVEIALRYG